MDISLSPSYEQFLQNKITEGIYEAINTTLNIAISGTCISRLDILNADLHKGNDNYETGRYSEGTVLRILSRYQNIFTIL